jgi:hypothetical protein
METSSDYYNKWEWETASAYRVRKDVLQTWHVFTFTFPWQFCAAGVFQSVSGLPRRSTINESRLMRTSRLRALFNGEQIKVEVSLVPPEGDKRRGISVIALIEAVNLTHLLTVCVSLSGNRRQQQVRILAASATEHGRQTAELRLSVCPG